jgi:hypothetical protein
VPYFFHHQLQQNQHLSIHSFAFSFVYGWDDEQPVWEIKGYTMQVFYDAMICNNQYGCHLILILAFPSLIILFDALCYCSPTWDNTCDWAGYLTFGYPHLTHDDQHACYLCHMLIINQSLNWRRPSYLRYAMLSCLTIRVLSFKIGL